MTTLLQRHGLRERLADALAAELGLGGVRVCDLKRGQRAALVSGAGVPWGWGIWNTGTCPGGYEGPEGGSGRCWCARVLYNVKLGCVGPWGWMP